MIFMRNNKCIILKNVVKTTDIFLLLLFLKCLIFMIWLKVRAGADILANNSISIYNSCLMEM